MSLAHFMLLGFAALGKAASSPLLSLLLGTEASRSCPALLPLDWNVNKPAGKTKTQPSAAGRRGARLATGSRELTVHVHHSRGGAILWRGHL